MIPVDPATLAVLTIIAICLIALGAVLVIEGVSNEARATVVGALIGTLGGVAVFGYRRRGGGPPEHGGGVDGGL